MLSNEVITHIKNGGTANLVINNSTYKVTKRSCTLFIDVADMSKVIVSKFTGWDYYKLKTSRIYYKAIDVTEIPFAPASRWYLS